MPRKRTEEQELHRLMEQAGLVKRNRNPKGRNQYNTPNRLHGPPVITDKQRAAAKRATEALRLKREAQKQLKQETGLLPKAFEGHLQQKQRRFLAAYAVKGSIRGAMRLSRVDTRWHYHWLSTDNDYSCAFQRAEEIYSDNIVGEIRRRGIDGHEKPLSYRGLLTGDKITEYSDALAIAAVKAVRPEYRDGQQVIVGPTKIAIEITQLESKEAKPEGETIEIAVDKPE